METTSISGEGLSEVVKAAVALIGKEQKAPYEQGQIDLTDKAVVEAADRKRFAFVNGIVKAVETRKVFTRDKNFQDKIDAVLTNPIGGLVIFAGIMFLVFQISQAWVGPWIADFLVGWIDTFKEWVAGLLEGLVIDREAWGAAVHGVKKSWT